MCSFVVDSYRTARQTPVCAVSIAYCISILLVLCFGVVHNIPQLWKNILMMPLDLDSTGYQSVIRVKEVKHKEIDERRFLTSRTVIAK